MDLYNEKIGDLLNALLSHNDLQMVADKAALALNNPVALFDSSYYVMVYSSVHTSTDYVWTEGLRRGFCTYEYISLIHSTVPSLESENRNSFAITDEVSPIRRMLGRLVINEATIGYFAVLESNAPLENIRAEVYELVAGILAKAVNTERSMMYYRKNLSHENILIDLLNSGTANRKLFRERIRGSEFDKPALYQLFCIDMTHFATGNMADPSLKATMQRTLPSSWSVYDKQYIVILVNLEHEFYRREHALDKWSAFLKENKLRAGQSDAFNDLYLIPGFYQQSIRVLELAKLYSDTRVIVPYDDYKMQSAFTALPAAHLKTDYCSNTVKQIQAYDITHNTEYLKTMFHYLDCGRGFKETASVMHLHRNTVIYRISRIKEIFHIDFQDEKQNLENYFSCLILQYAEKVQV